MFTKTSKTKTKAQAMVEFALVLPILLVVVYGLLEAGRLLFIFASVNTASRQAARYGSAIGLVDSGVPHYEDCAGITAAANNVAFIAPFTNVNITYDAGLDGSGNTVPITYGGSPGTTIDIDPANGNRCPTVPAGTVGDGDRVSVYVSAQFSPIIPLIPLGPMTIESTASRTIVGQISIHVTAQPLHWDPADGSALSISLDIIPSPTTYSYAGDTIIYTYKITNIGSLNVDGPFEVTDNVFHTDANCSGAAGSLAPDESTTCTYTYTITQADIDRGYLTNTARALGTISPVTSNQAEATVTLAPDPQLALLQIIPDPTAAFNVGERIDFFYTIENIGNVPLDSFSAVDSGMALNFTCPGGTLQPGDTDTCSGYYLLSAADINNGSLDYVAAVQAGDGTLSNVESAFVLTTRLFLVEIAPNYSSVNTVGQVIQYTYTLQNRGSVNITSIDNITGTNVQNVQCSGADLPLSLNLAPNSTVTCVSTYTVQQSNLDAGGTLALDARVTATAGGESLTSNQRTSSLTVLQTPVLDLSISATPNPVPETETLATYTYTLTNNGNVSLKGFTISDDIYGELTCENPATLLAPGQTRTCFTAPAAKVTRTITPEDRDEGSIKNQATAKATYGTSLATTSSNLESYFLFTYDQPRITLILTADPALATIGEQVTFNFLIKNTGNADLSPFTLTKVGNTGPDLQLYGCDPIALGIGESKLCQASHIVSADVTATWQVTAPEAANPSVDSASVTVQEAVGCDPRHTPLVTSPVFSFTILNNGDAAITVSEITVNWNNAGGNGIQEITLGGVTIWSGNTNQNPATFNTFTGLAGARTIPASGNKQMIFIFKNTYVPFDPKSEWVQVAFAEPSCSGIILSTDNQGQTP